MGLTSSSSTNLPPAYDGDRKEKAVTYIPCTQSLLTNPRRSNKAGKKVLVVGAGCAGLGAAWHLNRAGVDVTVFEELGKLGGHANTVNADGVDIDTGFMVYNTLNYPNLCAFFDELGVEGDATAMGFSVSMDNGSLEWCSDTLAGLFATSSNLTNPQFYLMFKDIIRFNQVATEMLKFTDDNPVKRMTVQEFLRHHSLSDAFRDYYLIPMTAAIWSASAKDMLNFPAANLFTFLNNHLLLQISTHISWKTPKNRSFEYVSKVQKELEGKYYLNKKITSFERINTGDDSSTTIIRIKDEQDKTHEFDEVIFACHPDQTLKILGSAATDTECRLLGNFKYADNVTYVHSDESLMPQSKAAWTSWNYMGNTIKSTGGVEDDSKPVYVTYWINKLQNLTHPRPIFVSLNPHAPPAKDKTMHTINYAHPQFNAETVKAQRGVSAIQGYHNTYYCGAWMGYGFHEDGFRSGIEVAMAVSGKPPVWVEKYGQYQMIPAPKAALYEAKEKSLVSRVISTLAAPVTSVFEIACMNQVVGFLRAGFANGKGRLTIQFPREKNMKDIVIQAGGGVIGGQDVVLVIKDTWCFVRLALEADLGLARSYIAGEWEILHTGPYADGLTRFYQLLIDNSPTGKTTTEDGLNTTKLITAWLGSAANALYYKIAMDNSIANSKSHIHAHYDLSNDLFRTFLDKDHMMYSCALFETEVVPPTTTNAHPSVKFVSTLEQAQLRKVDELLRRLEPIEPHHTLLDIGFGWGGISIRAAEKYGCKVVGITLSKEQKALAEERVRVKGLQDKISFELIDYRDFAKKASNQKRFERIVSCEMIEAVGHNHLGSFFGCVESVLAIDGIFVMQAITMPDSRYPAYIKSADFANTIIFPGGCCPSVSALLSAMAEHSSLYLDNCTNTNLHYAETLRQWRKRFNDNLPRVLELGFDDTFIRLWNLYFCYCEAGFENQVINLNMLTFSRPGNPNMLSPRLVDHQAVGYIPLK